MKKVLALVLAAAMLCAMALSTLAEDKKTIGIVMPNATHGFTGESVKHAEAEIKKLAYKFLTAGESSEQANHIDTLIAQGVDMIFLWPMNGDELRSSAQTIVDANIPLMIYDRLIEGFTPTAEAMGDNDKIGEGTGEYMNAYFKDQLAAGEKIQILQFLGDSSTVPMQRSNGFKKTANENIEIVQEFVTDWQRSVALEQMESFLETKSAEEIEAIDAIFTHDDEVAMGILDAINNYSGSAKLNIKLITGVQACKEFLELMPDAKIDLMTYSFAPSMIRTAIDMAVEIMKGEQISGMQLLPTTMVDKTNVAEYMAGEEYTVRYSL